MEHKVFLAVGHGGNDPGATGNGFREKDLNLSIALACQAELVRHGVNVAMSRTKDEGETLADQVGECNAFGPQLAVNIHNNAGGGDGAEAYHHHGGGIGKTLAQNILAEIVQIGQNSRGAKIRKNSKGEDYYGFIRDTNCPAVIVECAFVDHAKDIQIIDTAAEQQAMGAAIAKGILQTLGIAYRDVAPAYTHADFLKELQEALGAPVTGKPDLVTLGMTVAVSAKVNPKHAVVKPLQKRLNALGYEEVGTADGEAGPKFTSAVLHYQMDHGCTQTGALQDWDKSWCKLIWG